MALAVAREGFRGPAPPLVFAIAGEGEGERKGELEIGIAEGSGEEDMAWLGARNLNNCLLAGVFV